MSASNPQLQERTDEFRRLLCDVSQKLVENEVTQIEYLKYMYTGTKRTGIELLIELENRGVFSPTNTEPLVKLLEDIKRHDIAKYIRDEYQTKYPDQNGDICCDGCTEMEPPQSPTSFSTNEDTGNLQSRSYSLPSRTDDHNSNNGDGIPRPKPSEVDKSKRSSSWSITVNVSPSKGSETLPVTIKKRHHKPSCIPSYKSLTTSPSKLSNASLSPVAEGVSIDEINKGNGLVMEALSEEALDDEDEYREVPPILEVKVMNPKAAENPSHPHTHTYTQGASKHISKLKRLGSKFGLPGKRSKSKKCQERITKCTWTIEKNSLLHCIWEHRHHEYLKHSEPIPIDIESSELNPYVSLRLYPFGLFEDENRSMTLLLNPIIPDQCPPLPEDAKFSLSWGIFTLEADAENLLEQSKKPVKAQFVQGVVYIHKFLPHALLQEHKCEELKICIFLSTGYSCPNTHTVINASHE